MSLAYANDLIQLDKGTLSIESHPDQVATVTTSLLGLVWKRGARVGEACSVQLAKPLTRTPDGLWPGG